LKKPLTDHIRTLLTLSILALMFVGCSQSGTTFESPMGYSLKYDESFKDLGSDENDLTLALEQEKYPDFTPVLLANSSKIDKDQDEKKVFEELHSELTAEGTKGISEPKRLEAPGADLFYVTWTTKEGGQETVARLYSIYEPSSGLQVRLVAVCAKKDKDVLDKFDAVAKTAELPRVIEVSF
jgi:hypothetical protein